MKVNKSVAMLAGSMVALGVCSSTLSASSAPASPGAVPRPQMDLAFCIDTTGSMQGEIDMVKTKTKEMVAKLSSGKPAPIVRIALVAYRDKGDKYVTKVFPFSDDIDHVVKDISSLEANGGGDTPEAVDQGLHAALSELKWDENKHTAKLLFLIGDAGPHGGKDDLDWRQDCRNAIKHGIQINTMGCQGLSDSPLAVFKEIASLTDGKFESLAYRQEVVDARGGRSTVVSSGGVFYKMSPKADVDWKTAVSKGMLEKVASPSIYTAGMKSAGGGGVSAAAAYSSFPRADSDERSRGFARADGPASSITARASGSYVSGSRKENNLDELMLDAAKAKAAESLKIGY